MKGILLALSLLLLFPEMTAAAEEKKKPVAVPQRKVRPKKAVKPQEAFERVEKAGGPVAGDEKPVGEEAFPQQAYVERPIEAVLVLDSSGSMRKTDPERLRNKAAKLFLRFLTPSDRVAVVEFDQEVRTVQSFTAVTPEGLPALDQAIDRTSAEGRFTDLQAPFEVILKLFKEQGSRNGLPTVLMLSDGRLDPHPSRGTAEQLRERLFTADLPQYKSRKISVYTVSLGAEADRDLLRQIADATDALHWYAPDVNTVHLGFSDLFLALRKPQVAPLEEDGFQIDSAVKEATFYVTRKNSEEAVTFVTPKEERLMNDNMPASVRWYRGPHYDVVTIQNPQSGTWRIEGVEGANGYATLVTDLKLQVRWPADKIQAGDIVVVSARLVEGDKTFSRPEFRETGFFKYRVLDGEEAIAQGTLVDDGQGRDREAGDSIYTGEVKIEHAGELKMWVGVVSPTFTRQQHFPFSVKENLLKLTLVEGERLRVQLSKEVEKWKNIDVSALARNQFGRCWIPVSPVEGEESAYEGSVAVLPSGTYTVRARAAGHSPRGRTLEEYSQQLTVTSQGPGSCVLEAPVTLVESAGGIASIILTVSASYLWCWYLFRRSGRLRAASIAAAESDVRPYLVPKELSDALAGVRERASKSFRSPGERDRSLFALVPDAFTPEALREMKVDDTPPPAPSDTAEKQEAEGEATTS